MDWRDWSGVKSTCCTCRVPKFGSQHSCWVTQVPVTPASGDRAPLASVVSYTHVHILTQRHTNIYIIKKQPLFKNPIKSLFGVSKYIYTYEYEYMYKNVSIYTVTETVELREKKRSQSLQNTQYYNYSSTIFSTSHLGHTLLSSGSSLLTTS